MTNVIAHMQRQIEELTRRLNNVVREGRVTDVDEKKGMVRLALAEGADGKEVKSPWVRPSENAGSLQTWALPKKGQWMKLFSPGGEIGKNSMALPHSWSNDTSQPSAEAGEPMFKAGSSTIKLKDGQITLSAAKLVINGDIETTGKLTNNGKDVSSTHRHSGVESGGATTEPPIGEE